MLLKKVHVEFIGSLWHRNRLGGDCASAYIGTTADGKAVDLIACSDETSIAFLSTNVDRASMLLLGGSDNGFLVPGFHPADIKTGHRDLSIEGKEGVFSLTKKEFSVEITPGGVRATTIRNDPKAKKQNKPGESSHAFASKDVRKPSWAVDMRTAEPYPTDRFLFDQKVYESLKKLSDNGRHAVDNIIFKIPGESIGILWAATFVDGIHLGIITSIGLDYDET